MIAAGAAATLPLSTVLSAGLPGAEPVAEWLAADPDRRDVDLAGTGGLDRHRDQVQLRRSRLSLAAWGRDRNRVTLCRPPSPAAAGGC
ncbi:hypothetical protein [Alloactinosynnema sp. L-07]|nr:hypothetical protein [Alloactinosynnema sp. L-07]